MYIQINKSSMIKSQKKKGIYYGYIFKIVFYSIKKRKNIFTYFPRWSLK